jgi:NitT/TauT family transport system permease protein
MHAMSTDQHGPAATGVAVAPSEGYAAYLRALKRRRLQIHGWQLGLLASILIGWEAAPRLGLINPLLTSYPSAVARTLVKLWQEGTLFTHVGATLVSTIVGLVAALVLGLLLAIVLWMSPSVSRVLDPFIVVLNALPKIALGPIFYIWLGDTMSIYAMAVAVAALVTALMLHTGFAAINPDQIRLVRLYGASKLDTLRLIVLPGSVPTIVSTLKVTVGLALIGVIVGEFQSAKRGLGYLISYGGQIFEMNLVMAAILLLAVISWVLFFVIQLFERRFTRRV